MVPAARPRFASLALERIAPSSYRRAHSHFPLRRARARRRADEWRAGAMQAAECGRKTLIAIPTSCGLSSTSARPRSRRSPREFWFETLAGATRGCQQGECADYAPGKGCGLLLLLMVIGEGRFLVFWQRVFSQFLKEHLHRSLVLRVVALPDQSRVIIDFDVGRHAVVLHVPLFR